MKFYAWKETLSLKFYEFNSRVDKEIKERVIGLLKPLKFELFKI